jgi:hypothetical protein
METLDLKYFNIHPDIIDDEYKHLDYISEQFNDTVTLGHWRDMGHTGAIGGLLCDMRNPQPSWNDKIIDTFVKVYGWKDIGTSYYKMLPGSSLPEHQDTYKKYIEIFNLQGKEQSIWRSIVFLEEWQSGHYLEIDGKPHTGWSKGSVVTWQYNTPHIAANLGMTPRYTLQITGHE